MSKVRVDTIASLDDEFEIDVKHLTTILTVSGTVVDTTGTAKDKVMSQDAVTTELNNVTTELNNKVAQVVGKDLSDNNFTDDDRTKLDLIALPRSSTSEVYTYTNGAVTKITEDGADTDITYNPDGTVNTVTYLNGTKMRTETYTYLAGQVTGMTASEV